MPISTALSKTLFAYLDNTNLGGAELFLLEILKLTDHWGYKNFLITGKAGALHEAFECCTQAVLVTPFPYRAKPFSWLHLPKFLWKNRRFIKKYTPKGTPPVFFVNDVYPLWAALKVRNLFKGGVCYALWQGEYVFKGTCCLQKWIQSGAKEADALLASSFVAEHMNTAKLLVKPVQTLDPTRDFSAFLPSLYDFQALRAKYGAAPTDKIAVICGRVQPDKGQNWLAEAFLKNPELYKNWKLYIVGPIAPHFETFWKQIKTQDTRNHIHLIGLSKEIPHWLGIADLVLFPGMVNESFGFGCLEALLMEKPILAFDVGTFGHWLGPDYPGLIQPKEKQRYMELWQKFTKEPQFLKDQLPSAETLRNKFNFKQFKSQLGAILMDSRGL